MGNGIKGDSMKRGNQKLERPFLYHSSRLNDIRNTIHGRSFDRKKDRRGW